MTKTCKIPKLPLKLNWEKVVPYLGPARETLARLTMKDIPKASLQEAKASEKTSKSKNASQIQDALSFAIQSKTPFSYKTWCGIHAIVKQDFPNPGKIRTQQNWIGPEKSPIEKAYFFPPPPSKVLGHLRDLERYLRTKDLDPLVQIAVAFAYFLMIHPFMDGNGRVARILIPVFAVKKKLLQQPILFMSPYFEKHRGQYMQTLHDISANKDWEGWIVFFLKGVQMTPQNHSVY